MFPLGKRGTMRGLAAPQAASAGDNFSRFILHVDMDAFYAQVEQLKRPDLRGRPVIVGPGESLRGVVTACSYEARAFGVHAGMSAMDAKKLCPHAVFLHGDMDAYSHYSGLSREVFAEFTPMVEPASIDEAYLDVTACGRLYPTVIDLSADLKKRMKERIGLTCSVGISTNKHLAKVASALEKPDGLTTLFPEELETKLHPLPVGKLYGLGPVTEASFQSAGIFTIGQLVSTPDDYLQQRLGHTGEYFKKVALGLDDSPVHTYTEMSDEKSMSHERTFDYRKADITFIHSVLLDLTDRVVTRLQKRHFLAKTLTLRLRYTSFKTITRDKTIDAPTRSVDRIYKTVVSLLPPRVTIEHRVRLLGVRASNLLDETEMQSLDLFDQRVSEKESDASNAIEQVRAKFGRNAIVRAGSLKYIDS